MGLVDLDPGDIGLLCASFCGTVDRTCTERRTHMEAISYTNARTNLAKTMEKVCEDHDFVIITRRNERSVVMMSLEDFQALEETSYLLRSPKNARRLLESVAQLESNGGTERQITL